MEIAGEHSCILAERGCTRKSVQIGNKLCGRCFEAHPFILRQIIGNSDDPNLQNELKLATDQYNRLNKSSPFADIQSYHCITRQNRVQNESWLVELISARQEWYEAENEKLTTNEYWSEQATMPCDDFNPLPDMLCKYCKMAVKDRALDEEWLSEAFTKMFRLKHVPGRPKDVEGVPELSFSQE